MPARPGGQGGVVADEGGRGAGRGHGAKGRRQAVGDAADAGDAGDAGAPGRGDRGRDARRRVAEAHRGLRMDPQAPQAATPMPACGLRAVAVDAYPFFSCS
jgi:hypothetical protein